MPFETIIYETRGPVALIRLNRPKALNALNSQVARELGQALHAADSDPAIGCIVLTGNEKAFAAGADIKEMQGKTFQGVYMEDFITKEWEEVQKIRKPIIAAVAGYAFGGGCEVAMSCDFIIAARSAKFGQPEINLGIMPGAGGTQRLPRFIGKSKAMEMCLTGRAIDAEEAERCGLVSRIVDDDKLVDEAVKTAEIIAKKSRPVVYMVKESINRAYETTLREGVLFERRVFHSAFALEDKNEGMAAFIEKREPKFKNR
jgi:enoyl-CoA hydratase